MEQDKAIELAEKGYNIFLTGQAGTGKTYTLNKIIKRLKNKGLIVSKTASTGIASTHINGQTIHSWASIGIKKELIIDDLFKIKNYKYSYERIFNTDVLVIDEISMLHDYRLDLVDEVCRFIKNSKKSFGGIQVIVCGDFFQLPPVEKNNSKNYCFHANSWESGEFITCYLKKIYRQDDQELIAILNNIRKNNISQIDKEKLDFLSCNNKYSDCATNLFCKNINVDILNTSELAKLRTESFISNMTCSGIEHKIIALKKNSLAVEKLILKEGAKVMIIVNNPKQNVVNGTLGEIIDLSDFDEGIIKFQEYKTGRIIDIIKHTWKMEEYNNFTGRDETVATITQYPLRLAWALTIHKSQGATFDFVNLDLTDTFVENMGYVALSRLTGLRGLYLSGYNDVALHIDNYIIDKDKEFQEQSNKNEEL